MIKRNARIARELVRIARELVIADEQNKLKNEIEKGLEENNVDEDIRKEIEKMMRSASVRLAASGDAPEKMDDVLILEKNKRTLLDYFKKIALWIKNHKLPTAIAVTLVCFMLHKYINGGDVTDTVKSFVSNLLEEGGLAAIVKNVISGVLGVVGGNKFLKK